MPLPLLSLTLMDAYGRTTVKLLEMHDEILHSDQVSSAQQFIVHLQAVTDLAVVRADIIYRGIDPGFAAQEGANVDVGGTFTGLLLAGNGKKASHKLPGVKSSLVNLDGSIPISGAVGTYLNWFEDGGGLYLSDGEQVDSWLSGALDK